MVGDANLIRRNIKNCIRDNGLRYNWVAEQMGMSWGNFSAMLNGRNAVRAEYLPILAKIIRVEINDFFKEEEDDSKKEIQV